MFIVRTVSPAARKRQRRVNGDRLGWCTLAFWNLWARKSQSL